MDGKRMQAVRQILNGTEDIDRQAHFFCDLMVGDNDYKGGPDEGMTFARLFNKGLDMSVTAHHRKIFAKYSHVIHREGAESFVFGRYKFFLFEEDRVDPYVLEKQPFYSFEFDARGQVLNDESLCVAPSLVFAPQVKVGFKRTILAALHDRMTE